MSIDLDDFWIQFFLSILQSIFHSITLVTFLSSYITLETKTSLTSKRHIQQLTESEIIALAKKDRKYFGTLYDRYFDQIFRFVFKRLGGDEDTAGDLSQQTFIKAMANMEKYEDRGFPFSSWLYRIAQNEVFVSSVM